MSYGKDMNEVARQRVWEEHLVKLSAQSRKAGALNTNFTVNPYHMQGKTITEPKLNARPARFLDREHAALVSITKQLGDRAEKVLGPLPPAPGTSSTLPPLSTKSNGGSARGASTAGESLPPLQSTNNGAPADDIGQKSLRQLREVHRAPTQKYQFPQTEAQELGWLSKPLLAGPPVIHAKKSCEETRFATHAVKMNAKRM